MSDELFDRRIDAYIEKAAPFAQPILTHLRELMHQACPHISETIKWRMPFFQQQGVILAHMAAFNQHCAFGFWGSEMQKVLAADGLKSRGAMGALGRIESLDNLPPDRELLGYMRQAAALVESGERTKSIDRPKKKGPAKSVTVPPELASAIKKNKHAAKAFAGFSPSNRRDYVEWIVQARRPETKKKRIVQAVEWIAQGKPRHWKYLSC